MPELLTDEQRFNEGTGTLGWVANDANTTLARSTDQAHEGTKSIAVTAIAAGGVSARVDPRPSASPGDLVSASVWLRNTTAHFPRLYKRHFDGAGGLLAGDVTNDPAESTTVWYQASIAAGAAVAGTVTVGMLIEWYGLAAGETVYFDDASMVLTSGLTPGMHVTIRPV